MSNYNFQLETIPDEKVAAMIRGLPVNPRSATVILYGPYDLADLTRQASEVVPGVTLAAPPGVRQVFELVEPTNDVIARAYLEQVTVIRKRRELGFPAGIKYDPKSLEISRAEWRVRTRDYSTDILLNGTAFQIGSSDELTEEIEKIFRDLGVEWMADSARRMQRARNLGLR